MPQLLYLIGVPGAGKTTLVNAALEGIDCKIEPKPVPHCCYAPGLVQLGVPREGHGGTDALSMSIAPKVVEALRKEEWTHVFAEGDRLATHSFFESVLKLGWDLKVLWLLTPPFVAAQRRQGRGTSQNEVWLRGRETKVYALGRRWSRPADVLDGNLPVEQLVERLQQEPVIQALRGEA